MKVLFALGSEQKAKKVAEEYYRKYGEELEYKNVFFFKALLDEVKSNKTYDRIVISEELEQFHVKNLEALDKFVFKNIDNVTDEIEDSEVIFICSDRRTKQNDKFVERLFNIGVYNTLIGDERRFEPLCDYIKKPLNKKEAKRHLNITAVVSEGELASDDTVEEVQIMHILKYYDGIRGKTEEYLPAFDRIAEQYSRNQLKVIINFLPHDVKNVVLSYQKYAYLREGIPETSNTSKNTKTLSNKPGKKGLFGILKENKNKEQVKKQQPQVIVENSNNDFEARARQEALERQQAELKVRAEQEAMQREQAMLKARAEQDAKEREQAMLREKAQKEAASNFQNNDNDLDIQVEVMPGVVGSDKTDNGQDANINSIQEELARQQAELKAKAEEEAFAKQQAELKAKAEEEAFAKQQAELKAKAEEEAFAKQQAELKAKAEQEAFAKQQAELKAKAEQEAFAKQQAELKAKAEQEAFAKQQAELKAKAEQEAFAKQQAELKAKAEQEALAKQQAELKAKAEQEALAKQQAELKAKAEQEALAKQQAEQEKRKSAEQERLEAERRKLEAEKLALEEERRKLREQSEQLSKSSTAIARKEFNDDVYNVQKVDYKKMVVFVGANKSGTTFLVNAVAHNLSENKVNVGVLDMTRDKSLYYIYNQDDKTLRQIAAECMQKLGNGIDSYIPVNKNMKVYTTIPGPASDSRRAFKNRAIIDSVTNFNNVVIIDADFTTPLEYYEKADEIYIIQDLDIMKMQETTLFLRELKNRSINMNKVKIIINKYVKSLLTPKRMIQGLSYYNDPQMSFTDELLDSKVQHFVVPFNVENYSRYIDGMYKNNLDYKKYTPDFLSAIAEVSKNVFKRTESGIKRRGFFG